MKEIELTQGKVVLVDDKDYTYLSRYKWYAHHNSITGRGYVAGYVDGVYTLMHRYIMETSDGMDVDHIDGDGFNNLRSNLRNCTRAQNLQNRKAAVKDSASQYIGVCWDTSRNKWVARISKEGYTKMIGRFDTEEEAARARDEYTKHWFGEFGKLNFPEDGLL